MTTDLTSVVARYERLLALVENEAGNAANMIDALSTKLQEYAAIVAAHEEQRATNASALRSASIWLDGDTTIDGYSLEDLVDGAVDRIRYQAERIDFLENEVTELSLEPQR